MAASTTPSRDALKGVVLGCALLASLGSSIASIQIPVPITQGGTGQTAVTAAFNALDPLTTQGDVLYHNGTDSVRLAAGTSGKVFTTKGAGANPTWESQLLYVNFASGDSGGFNLPQNTSWYIANLYGADPSSTEAIGGVTFGIIVPKSGTINRVDITQVVLGTNGVAGENITYVLRKNATTNSSNIALIDTSTDNQTVTSTALGFSVTVGDILAVRMTSPVTWTTAPTVMFVMCAFIIETP